MRTVTATEKYKAVNEGRMAKKEFVRQMRQQYPMYISQYDGFDSTVQILKNRQMLFEAAPKAPKAFSGVKVYDDRPALTYSLDALDRGIRAELAGMGITMPHQGVKPEDYIKAETKAKDNLEKNPTHYLDLMSGESNKVDKHDKEKEVKRGAADKDTFNDMKKATLKEEYEPGTIAPKDLYYSDKHGKLVAMDDVDDKYHDSLDLVYRKGDKIEDPMDEVDANPQMSEDAIKAMLGQVVGALRAKYPDITAGIVKDFIRTHYEDLKAGADIETEFGEYIDANYEGPADMREAEEGIDMSSKDGYIAFIDNENILANYNIEDAEEMARELAMNHHDAGKDQDNFVKSFMAAYKEGGYDYDDQVHEKQGKDHDGDGDIDSDDYMAAKDKAIKKAMGKDVDEDQERDHNFYDNKEKAQKIMQIAKDAIALMDEQPGTSVKDAIEAVMEFMDESYAMKRMQRAHTQDRLAGKKSTYDKAKEKEDKKKEQLKEAIKTIIKKSLINEAATVKLSDFAESYETFPGVKPVVNELENIVTEIESFYDKMSDKIANAFAKTGDFENEEGLKIGGFIAPSLESAFKQDLSKVIKKGTFFNKIELPKLRTITQADVDAHNSGDRPLGEEEIEEKNTVYTPNF